MQTTEPANASNISASEIRRPNRRYLYFTVFIAGMSTLAIEFTASRMVQAIYGTSNIVWANVIGLVLLSLTVGYALGGRWADRDPTLKRYYKLLTVAGIASLVFLLLASRLLSTAAAALAALNAGAVAGSLVGVILTLVVPITLLGFVSPFAIRLAVDDVSEAGRVSGQVYAISTMGSLLGTYIPVLITIPAAGTRLTAVIFGSLLTAVGIIGLLKRQPKYALIGMVATLLFLVTTASWLSAPLKTLPGLIYSTESSYNYIAVVENNACRYLLLNEGVAYHSYACDDGAAPSVSVWNMMLVAPLLAETEDVDKVAVVGLAAGTIAVLFDENFGPAQIDGIEIDGEIVAIGNDYFGMSRPNLNVFVGDGRYELNQRDEQYAVITIDAYKVPYIPWHLTTQQFFQEVAVRLKPDGAVAINVGRTATDRRLVTAMTATLQTVFPTVHTIDVPGSLNTILVATKQESAQGLAGLEAALNGANAEMHDVISGAIAGYRPSVASDIVFTDERAPVETIVDTLVLQTLIDQGLSGLPAPDG